MKIKQFIDDLKSVPGDIVVVHSGLMGLRKLGLSVPGIVDVLMDVYRDRQLVMPAYTYDFPRTGVFDAVLSKPSTGAVCEEYMSRQGVVRTSHAMNSYLSIPGLPQQLRDGWGYGGVMWYLWKQNAAFISLGVPILKSCSYFHLAECELGVPYRFSKTFRGVYEWDNVFYREIESEAYVGPLGCPQDFWAAPADALLEKWELKHRCRYFDWLEMRHIHLAAKECLRKDPYSLLRNGPEVKAYVESGGLERERLAAA